MSSHAEEDIAEKIFFLLIQGLTVLDLIIYHNIYFLL